MAIMTLSSDKILAHIPPSKGPAPVHLWTPPFRGHLDMQIKRDGRWIHEGGEITRIKMVQLFASILKREGDAYFLVTPVEKVGITVEDAPFVAVDLEVTGRGASQRLTFTTNLGETAVAGPDNAIWLKSDEGTQEPSPYVMIRSGLMARMDRKTFYRLVDLGCEQEVDGTVMFGVFSAGVFFPMMPAKDLYEE